MYVHVQLILSTGMTVAWVRLNKLTAEAHSERFKAIFSSVAKTYPSFSVEKSLVGILMDWSDQQFNGLEQAVEKDVAEAVVKGCQVYPTVCRLNVISMFEIQAFPYSFRFIS